MHTTYRQYLQYALQERCAKNPSYSLRAFARQVGVSPSHLSRVLKGQKDISAAAAQRIVRHLNLKRPEMEHFLDLVGWETSEGQAKVLLEKRVSARAASIARRTLRLDVFRLIADWYHLPLLELAATRGFKSDPRWIAAKLGITLPEAKASLRLHLALKLLHLQADGKLIRSDDASVETTDDIPAAAIRRHHEQMSRKAARAIHEQTLVEREFQSVQFPVEEKKIQKVKELIREFAQKLENDFRSSEGEDVYQINLQLFRLTRRTRLRRGKS